MSEVDKQWEQYISDHPEYRTRLMCQLSILVLLFCIGRVLVCAFNAQRSVEIPSTWEGGGLARGAPLKPACAGQLEWEGLPGIGPKLAARVVQYQATYGPIRSDDDLLAVKGIGPHLLSRMVPYLEFHTKLDKTVTCGIVPM